jgi:hypothetical protein
VFTVCIIGMASNSGRLVTYAGARENPRTRGRRILAAPLDGSYGIGIMMIRDVPEQGACADGPKHRSGRAGLVSVLPLTGA